MNARNDHSIGKVGSSANGHVFCVNTLLVNGYVNGVLVNGYLLRTLLTSECTMSVRSGPQWLDI